MFLDRQRLCSELMYPNFMPTGFMKEKGRAFLFVLALHRAEWSAARYMATAMSESKSNMALTRR